MAGHLNVLWATDGSEPGLAAAPMLQSLVLPVTQALHILAIAPNPMLSGARPDPVYFKPWTPEERRAAIDEAQDVAVRSAALLEARDVNISIGARFGHPIQEILRAAERLKVDLVVLGAKGHSNIKLMLLGSVAQGVLEYTRRSVLIVRPGSTNVRTAVVGIDGSKEALRAFAFFQSLSHEDPTHVVLSRVASLVEARALRGRATDAFSEAVEALNQQEFKQAQADLKAAQATARADSFTVETEVLAGKRGEQLVRSAERRNADLIVVGSRMPSRVRKYLLGGTAEMIAREAPTSALIVR